MADDDNGWTDGWAILEALAFRQFAAAGIALAGLVSLAAFKVWPFDASPAPLGNDPSIFEVVLTDRLMIGFLRAGLVAVVGYVVVSVPALIVARRWMKGLSTAGLTTDEGDTANRSIEMLQRELEATQEELEYTVAQYDTAQELLLEYEAEEEQADHGHSPPARGGEGDGEE